MKKQTNKKINNKTKKEGKTEKITEGKANMIAVQTYAKEFASLVPPKTLKETIEIIEIRAKNIGVKLDENTFKAFVDGISFLVENELYNSFDRNSRIIFLGSCLRIKELQEILHSKKYQNKSGKDIAAEIINKVIKF